MISGMVTDIQRFSLHDGPGIRTTVFLKGCLLHCAWCHNPETMKRGRELMFYHEKCISCRKCVEACPTSLHSFTDTTHGFLREHCSACGECVQECYSGALQLIGKCMPLAAVMAEIMEDFEFYGSDGGVTISGGEPVVQAEFTGAILQACKQAGIHTAIETTLCYDWSKIVPLLEAIDLVIFDVKMADTERHRQFTGASNRPVWENIRMLDKLGKPMIARTPLIAGVNDQEQEIAQTTAALSKLDHLLYYEFLPYHPLGTAKRTALGHAVPQFSPPTEQTISHLAGIGRTSNLRIFVNGKEHL